jgi:hypothetical protein
MPAPAALVEQQAQLCSKAAPAEKQERQRSIYNEV